MFLFLSVLILAAAAVPLILLMTRLNATAPEQRKKKIIAAAVPVLAAIILIILVNVFFSFYTDFLWFESINFEDRFTIELFTKIGLFVTGAVLSFLFVFLNLSFLYHYSKPRNAGLMRLGASFLAAVVLGIWSSNLWNSYLMYANRAASGMTDPIFGNDISFYLFALPFFSGIIGWLLFLISVVLILEILIIGRISYLDRKQDNGTGSFAAVLTSELRKPLLLLGTILFITLIFNTILSIYQQLYSDAGVVFGAGWLEVSVKIPALRVTAVIFSVSALLLLVSVFSKQFMKKIFFLKHTEEDQRLVSGKKTLITPVSFAVLLLVMNVILPSVFGGLVLEPNEITLEKPYIEHNINFTQEAYGIGPNTITEENFPVGREISQEVIDKNESTLSNIRLWDWRALQDNLKEQQEIRLYYSFHDVDIDRYYLEGDYTQVMLSVRELDITELDPNSQTWVSRHLKYTHGYGLVLLPVHEFLAQGKPHLLIKNIPPSVEVGGLKIERPEVYYGEKTNQHVYVNTKQEEFDYPSGEENVYSSYSGTGGVNIGNAFKRFVFAWKFDGHRQLFSNYFTGESRILFRRNILDRVRRLAPFLQFDRDPYPVLTEAGRIKYIIDAYTLSSAFPYSEPYYGAFSRFQGINYIRNSVKAVVDAYDGSVEFYAMTDSDPILNTLQTAYSGFFTPLSDMPEDIKKHVRYPVDILLIQSEVYSTYHMDDIQVFYQREDVWEFATERYRQNFQSVMPYYVMVNFPGTDAVEFVLMIPFTPKNKNVINAWMAGRSDFPQYGDIKVFTFPKGVEVLGPRQIEARIDQDAEMSQALSLWGQRGSEVIRGNLLAIPLFNENTIYILFSEPIFLQAENAQLPEIKRIALADQNRVVWAPRFDEALNRLLGRDRAGEQAAGQTQRAAAGQAAGTAQFAAVERAVSLFNDFLERLQDGDFENAGARLEELENVFSDISEQN